MQVFVMVNEEAERVVVIPAKSSKGAVKLLAAMMHSHNPKIWSAKPKDYWVDIDNGVWAFYDGPTNVEVTKPFMAFLRHFA